LVATTEVSVRAASASSSAAWAFAFDVALLFDFDFELPHLPLVLGPGRQPVEPGVDPAHAAVAAQKDDGRVRARLSKLG